MISEFLLWLFLRVCKGALNEFIAKLIDRYPEEVMHEMYVFNLSPRRDKWVSEQPKSTYNGDELEVNGGN